MLVELALFFTLAAAMTTAIVMVRDLVRSRLYVGVPVSLASLSAAAWLTGIVLHDPKGVPLLLGIAVVAVALTRLGLRRWSLLAAQLLAMTTLAFCTYLAYAAALPFIDRLNALGVFASCILLLLEFFALLLSVYYLFEILDVFSRRTRTAHIADPTYRPRVALQVPCYNEPVPVVRETLLALSRIDYPNLLVQVVDNNTRDPGLWQPLRALCDELGPRFQFMHLEPWPGYKAGALNEATRRLPDDVSIIGIVDADYIVRPGFLKATVGHFADARVAFVQTPQNYRDWHDSGYLRGLYYSYRYFFDVSMPARANRNAIIFAGTMGLIRRSSLTAIGGWEESVITEDAEASLRLLGLGGIGVYEPTPWGDGLMPLSFDGLKKQRFRWALGGIQILRRQWRELLPLAPHRLRLTWAQRLHYLFGSVHWFGDLLTAIFTVLLLLTAFASATHHRLDIREVTGVVLIAPLAFLVTGILRGLWALRRAEGCSWSDAWHALAIWFALSWVDTMAVVRGIASGQAAFLRTPKTRHGGPRLWPAIRSAATESLLAGLALLGAIVMLLTAPAIATAVLASMLLFEASVFASAPWASFAAEGIHLTPYRRMYGSSAQNTGDRPERHRGADVISAALLIGVGAVLAYGLLNAPPQEPPAPPQTPTIGSLSNPAPAASASPTPAPTQAPTPTPTTAPTPVPTATSASPTGTPPSPSPS